MIGRWITSEVGKDASGLQRESQAAVTNVRAGQHELPRAYGEAVASSSSGSSAEGTKPPS